MNILEKELSIIDKRCEIIKSEYCKHGMYLLDNLDYDNHKSKEYPNRLVVPIFWDVKNGGQFRSQFMFVKDADVADVELFNFYRKGSLVYNLAKEGYARASNSSYTKKTLDLRYGVVNPVIITHFFKLNNITSLSRQISLNKLFDFIANASSPRYKIFNRASTICASWAFLLLLASRDGSFSELRTKNYRASASTILDTFIFCAEHYYYLASNKKLKEPFLADSDKRKEQVNRIFATL